MDLFECSRDLAGQARRKLFNEIGGDVSVVISGNTANKAYLSGYWSMSHDVAPAYQSAVLARPDEAALVVSAADAGPALEATGHEELIFRYGFFCFESAVGYGPAHYDEPGHDTFGDAVTAALERFLHNDDIVGVDRSNGDALWDRVCTPLPAQRVVDITGSLDRSRRTKLPGEIERIRRSTKLVEDGLLSVRTHARAGMSEHDLAGLVAAAMVKGGGVPRFISVTSGSRSALADAYPTERRIEPGDLIRIDAGCVWRGYSSDMARTFVVGEPDSNQRKRYEAIRVGLEYELAEVRAGVNSTGLFENTIDMVRRSGIPTYRRQHCGHGIGINGYEYPLIGPESDATLTAGMCLCVETPFYEIGWGGMMLEDTILVSDDGYEPITTLPHDLIHI